MSSIRSILVTGTNRGVGLGLVKQLTKLPECPIVIATCRDQSKAKELTELAASNSKIHVLQFEVSDFASHEALAEKVSSIVGPDGLDVLVNNAGIFNKVLINEGTPEMMTENFVVNSVAPFFICRTFLPLLRKAEAKIEKPSKPLIVNMSSQGGSIGGTIVYGFYSYQASKAALNMITKSLQVELVHKGIKCIALHPGWVLTSMGGPDAPMSVEESATHCVQTIVKVFKGEIAKDDEVFLSYDGTIIPW